LAKQWPAFRQHFNNNGNLGTVNAECSELPSETSIAVMLPSSVAITVMSEPLSSEDFITPASAQYIVLHKTTHAPLTIHTNYNGPYGRKKEEKKTVFDTKDN